MGLGIKENILKVNKQKHINLTLTKFLRKRVVFKIKIIKNYREVKVQNTRKQIASFRLTKRRKKKEKFKNNQKYQKL